MTHTIGVFDSGFGGLTVLRALIQRFPQAQFVFLGDTARLPYGSKSRRTIARYAAQSAQFLVREQGAEFLVIATDATVQSHAYSSACRARGLRAIEKACPLLVPLVEEGWTDHPVTAEVIRIYLEELSAQAAAEGLDPDTLVLGCTHYPLLRPLISRAVSHRIRVIDSAEAAAEAAALIFTQQDPSGSTHPQADGGTMVEIAPQTTLRCFATDSVEKFERLGSRFLNRPVGKVELVDLGG